MATKEQLETLKTLGVFQDALDKSIGDCTRGKTFMESFIECKTPVQQAACCEAYGMNTERIMKFVQAKEEEGSST